MYAALGRWKQEDWDFKASLGYISYLRPAWDSETLSQKERKKQKQKQKQKPNKTKKILNPKDKTIISFCMTFHI
jgi:hypothetical protein